jgi:hypothetical protein
MRFLARILTNNYLEGIASYLLAPLWRDKLCKVERGFNTRGYHNKLPIWLIEPLNVYQTEFRSRTVDLMRTILNAPSVNATAEPYNQIFMACLFPLLSMYYTRGVPP